MKLRIRNISEVGAIYVYKKFKTTQVLKQAGELEIVTKSDYVIVIRSSEKIFSIDLFYSQEGEVKDENLYFINRFLDKPCFAESNNNIDRKRMTTADRFIYGVLCDIYTKGFTEVYNEGWK